MKVRVGIVAPAPVRSTFERSAANVRGVEPRWVLYRGEEEISDLVESSLPLYDAICFAGEMPRDRCAEIVPDGMPCPSSDYRLSSWLSVSCVAAARWPTPATGMLAT